MAIFVIHEHHAKQLHFDLRLEIDNVLKSWAVPKGPSMNPGEKRLAIMVEDHAREYASFEGVIPQGMYGAGNVVIWDKGRFDIQGGSVQQGKLDIFFRGEKLKGGFALIRISGKENDWLLMKKRDEYADHSFTLKTMLPALKKSGKKRKSS